MDEEIAKALRELSEKINDVQRKIDRYFNNRCDNNAENIALVDCGIMDMAGEVSVHDEAIKELANVVSDLAEGKEIA